MPDQQVEALDIDYIVLSAVLAGSLTAIAVVATMIARPMLMEFGRQLPLPSLQLPAPSEG